jgi:hypothetical protein
MDWTAVWGVIGPAITGLGTWILTRKPRQAAIDSAVAQARADIAVADAEGAIYQRLRGELEAMRNDIAGLRKELDDERAHSRRQDAYIWQLIRLLRERGIEPPPFEDGGQ